MKPSNLQNRTVRMRHSHSNRLSFDLRLATLPNYLPDFCHYMSHFLLVIANYLFPFFIRLCKDTKDDNLLTVIVIKKAFHQKI